MKTKEQPLPEHLAQIQQIVISKGDKMKGGNAGKTQLNTSMEHPKDKKIWLVKWWGHYDPSDNHLSLHLDGNLVCSTKAGSEVWNKDHAERFIKEFDF